MPFANAKPTTDFRLRIQAIDSGRSSVLVLASGETFAGRGFGADAPALGEVVFNTALSGYQEIVTDPSYRGQLVCMTCIHIGNVGVNDLDCESGGPAAAGLIVRELARTVSSWRARGSLAEFLAAAGVAGISGIDTRALTRRLRTGGAVNGCIIAAADAGRGLQLARECPPMAGRNLAEQAAALEPAAAAAGAWIAAEDRYAPAPAADAPTVAVIDCGCKRAICRELAGRGINPVAVPAAAAGDELEQLEPDGVLLSNGPGDPQPLTETIALIRQLLAGATPLLAICLGHQALALAAGASAVKMKFGHHGSNHPVIEHASGKVMISSQNHGFAIAAASIPEEFEVTHSSLFDGTVQGLRHRHKPFASFQGHPEASPGPREMVGAFDRFAASVTEHAQARRR